MKKPYVVIAIIAFVVSVGIVEQTYQEMTGHDSSLIPRINRIDTSYVTVSAFGRQEYINTANIFAGLYTIEYQARMHAGKLLDQMKTALGLTKEEVPIREAYGVEIL